MTTTTRRLTRDDILAMGRAGSPWDFLPIARQALAQAPGDDGVRFMAAAALARLGLRSPALVELGALACVRAGQTHPDIDALRRACEQLPSDVVDLAQRRNTLRRNVEALASRGITLETGPQTAALARPWVRALDGNLLRAGNLSELGPLGPARGAAAVQAQSLRRPGRPYFSPVVLAGMAPPWHLVEAWTFTNADVVGYRPRLSIVEPDAIAFAEGLSLVDLTAIIADPRTEWFVGTGAVEAFSRTWRPRFAGALPDAVLSPAFAPPQRDVPEALKALLDAQKIEFDALRAQVDTLDVGRDSAWWARRFADARRGGEPLRVLVCTSRFSTFLRHAAADLCEAFTRAGCATRLLVEPDGFSWLSGVGYLREAAQHRPDLIVMLNFPRHMLRTVLPKNVPLVCWVQDALPHLFDSAVGKAQGPLDFLAGYLFPELFSKFGYPRERAMDAVVVAHSDKFGSAHGRPARRHELVAITHHSETVDAMHQRLVREAPEPAIAQVFELCRPRVEEAVARAGVFPPSVALRQAAEQSLLEVTGGVEDRARAMVQRLYAQPLADRMFRQQTLEWAARIAGRRGWRFALYGKWWEKHPTLSNFARGELTHGNDLRDVYASAALNLHASINTLVHQRVLECALAGGLTACRYQRDALAAPKTVVQRLLLTKRPDTIDPARGWLGFVIAEHPEAMQFACLASALGNPLDEGVLWIRPDRAEAIRRLDAASLREQDASWVLGDLPALTFTNEAELEAIAVRAVEHSAWRDAVADLSASRVRAALTHDVLVQRMLALVERGLGPAAAQVAA